MRKCYAPFHGPSERCCRPAVSTRGRRAGRPSPHYVYMYVGWVLVRQGNASSADAAQTRPRLTRLTARDTRFVSPACASTLCGQTHSGALSFSTLSTLSTRYGVRQPRVPLSPLRITARHRSTCCEWRRPCCLRFSSGHRWWRRQEFPFPRARRPRQGEGAGAAQEAPWRTRVRPPAECLLLWR